MENEIKELFFLKIIQNEQIYKTKNIKLTTSVILKK